MNLADSPRPPFEIVDRLAGRPAPDTLNEIAAGLFAARPWISPKYFYDPLGCRLFQAICELPEYYVTRTEALVFTQYRDAITAAAGTRRQLIDLGAGDCQKAACWFPFLDPCRYIAVDVARGIVESALAEFATEAPTTRFTGLIDDFSATLNLDGVLGPEPVTFFYPGSSIGNFTPTDATRFIAQMRRYCGAPGSGLLIGVDLVKDEATLVDAYDDAAGVTAAFNKNALNHIKRLTGATIDVAAFRHVGLFNRVESRIEMHLEAIRDTRITLPGPAGERTREFKAGERIHTENSYKYETEKFIGILRAAGFSDVQWWADAHRHFGVFFAQPGI